MMKPFFAWDKYLKAVGIVFDPKNPESSKEISIEIAQKKYRHLGYRHEPDSSCHSFGFYFFELCYYE